MTDWVFEPGHTAAEFVTRHMMGSKVLGHFTNVEVLEGRPCPET